jgi:putative membrane protein
MQDLVSQARKEGMISTGIDLFLAAVPATLVALDIAINGMLGLSTNKTATYITGGIIFALLCVSVFFRLRALRKISMLSGIRAAALYRNCVIVYICVIAITSIFLSIPLSISHKHLAMILCILIAFAGAIYMIVAWFCINFALARVSGVGIFETYVWLCVILFSLNALYHLIFPITLTITSIVHLLAWSKIEKISVKV